MVHNQFYQTYQQVNIQKLLDGRTRLEQQLIQTWTHEMKSIPDIDKVLEFEINTHDARGTVYIAKLENSQLKLSKGVCLGRDLSHGKFGIYKEEETKSIVLSDQTLDYWKWIAIEWFVDHVEIGRFAESDWKYLAIDWKESYND